MTLKNLIKNLKFDYVNPNITEENFPYVKPRKGTYKILRTDKNLTGQEWEKEIKKQGCSPATIQEFLEWSKNWNDEWLYFLGSKWSNPVDGSVYVPCVGVDGASRRFGLFDFRYRLSSYYGVFVRGESDTSDTPEHSDTSFACPWCKKEIKIIK